MAPVQPDGCLAAPTGGEGQGVLVLHAWWGLNDTIRATCDRLAAAGFVAFAPDLYQGRVADNIADAEALSQSLFVNPDRASADVTEAAMFLAGRTGGDVAVIGFSLGAYFALDISVTAPERVHSVVIFYGTRPGDYSRSQAAYLGHFAETDPFEPETAVDSLEESLRQAGRAVTFHRYPGTGHWFFEPDRLEAYDQAAASLAWERTLSFLRSTSPV